MNTLEITSNTELRAVADWRVETMGNATFVVDEDSSFEFLADECASDFLQELSETHKQLDVMFRCDPAKLTEVRNDGYLPFLCKPFGLNLLMHGHSFFGPNGKLPEEYRRELLNKIWREIQKHKGKLLAPKERQYICRDPDAPFPDVFLASGKPAFNRILHEETPSRDQFKRELLIDTKSLKRQSSSYSLSEESIALLAFEAFENTLVHAKRRKRQRLVEAFRSVSIELLKVSDAASNTRKLPPFISAFCNSRCTSAANTPAHFIALRVSDRGDGIHNTLKDCNIELPLDRLNFAFNLPSLQAGQEGLINSFSQSRLGLLRVKQASARLGALLVVKSAFFLTSHNFHTNPGLNIVLQEALIEEGPRKDFAVRFANCGSTLCCIWPVIQGAGDQPPFSFPDYRE